MEPKTVGETALTMAVMMLPSDANPQGQVHGGTIMKLGQTSVEQRRHTEAEERRDRRLATRVSPDHSN